MKKIYYLSMTLLAAMFLSITAQAQPYEATIIVVGADETPRSQDSAIVDSVKAWVTDVQYYSAGGFNDASADDLYGADRDEVDGVIISESIGSGGVGNFAVRDNYPVPAVTLEMGVFTSDAAATDKWAILLETGGIWGYGTPEVIDMSWVIVDDQHYITEGFSSGQTIAYTTDEDPTYGVPYLQGIANTHQILATAAREDGGSVEGYDQSQAGALIYVDNPKLVIMNAAHDYYPTGTPEFFQILRRSAEFLFEYIPDEPDAVAQNEINNVKLTAFPNPASDQFTVRYTAQSNTNAVATVYDVAGNEVATFNQNTVVGTNSIDINATEFNSGVYIVKLELEGQVGYSKVIVQ